MSKTVKCGCGCGKEISIEEAKHHIEVEKMAGYESVLKFLDLASRKLSEKAKQKTSIEDKEIYYKEVKILDNARRRLRSLYYVYMDNQIRKGKTMKERKIKFAVNVVKWFDRVNGNTYHSCRITRHKDGKNLYCPFTYGYGEHYKQTAFAAMEKAGWIKSDGYDWERQNNYPILWDVTDGKKRECVENGKE